MISSVTAGAAARNSASTSLSASFDNFLQLLTKQLEKQDPLSPMDATQFTSQLVQFSTVEQAIQTNSKLDRLVEVISSGAQTSALQYIDNTVETDTRVAQLAKQGEANFAYALPRAANEVRIAVLDADGEVVREAAGGRAMGANRFVWDGKGGSGNRLPAGVYRIEVTALDNAGNAIAVDARASGKVTGVSMVDGRLTLTVGGASLPVEAVTAVRRDAAA
jgi:flagellar basal-body rod modification protein FlgD